MVSLYPQQRRGTFFALETPRRRSLLIWREIGKAFPAGAKATDGRIFRHRALVGGPVWMWKQQGRHSLQLPECERVVFLGTALFLGPFLVRRETEKAFLQLPNPKMGGSGLFVCEQRSTGDLQPIISSAVLGARCGTRFRRVPEGSGKFRCTLRGKVPEGSGRFREGSANFGCRCLLSRRLLEHGLRFIPHPSLHR